MLRKLLRPKTLGAVGLLTLLAAMVLWPKSVAVDLAAVTRGPLRVTIDEEGETRVRHRFVVAAPLAGQVLRIELEPGDRVERGRTVLATFRPGAPALLDVRSRAEAEAAALVARAAVGQARAERRRAQAAAELARSELARYQELVKDRIIAQDAVDARAAQARSADESLRAAEFAVASAEHQVEMASARLLQAAGGSGGNIITIRSPIDGVVFKRLRESEAPVMAGTALIELGDPAQLEIVADLLSTEAVKVSAGNAVLVERWGGDHTLDAQVRRVEPSGFTKVSALGVEEQRVNVVMDLKDPGEAWKSLGDGYRVEVRIVIWESDDVLKVPTSALFRHGDRWAVYAVRNGQAHLRPCEIGRRNGLDAQVLSGLTVGEKVVVHPSDALRDGSWVAVRS